MPCWTRPQDTISSYDLDTGMLLWRNSCVSVQLWGPGVPYTSGSATIGAPVIVKPRLIFVGAATHGRV